MLVNGERVEDDLVAREAEDLRQRFERLSAEERRQHGLDRRTMRNTAVEWARENVIERTLLKQEALKDRRPLDDKQVENNLATVIKRSGGPEKFAEAGLDADEVRADIETRMRVDRLVASVTARIKEPRPKEMAEFYRRNGDRFKSPEEVRAAHIVKNVGKDVSAEEAKAAADAIRERLSTGANFAEVADEHSDCPGNGGDLGFFPRGRMVKEFEQTVFSMDVGETSEVFRTVFGFHIAKVLEKSPARLRPFGEVRGEIRNHLMEQRRTRAIEAYVDRLRERAEIRNGS